VLIFDIGVDTTLSRKQPLSPTTRPIYSIDLNKRKDRAKQVRKNNIRFQSIIFIINNHTPRHPVRIKVTKSKASYSNSACKADIVLCEAKLELYHQCKYKGQHQVHVSRAWIHHLCFDGLDPDISLNQGQLAGSIDSMVRVMDLVYCCLLLGAAWCWRNMYSYCLRLGCYHSANSWCLRSEEGEERS
jgi:hypothetical protein